MAELLEPIVPHYVHADLLKVVNPSLSSPPFSILPFLILLSQSEISPDIFLYSLNLFLIPLYHFIFQALSLEGSSKKQQSEIVKIVEHLPPANRATVERLCIFLESHMQHTGKLGAVQVWISPLFGTDSGAPSRTNFLDFQSLRFYSAFLLFFFSQSLISIDSTCCACVARCVDLSRNQQTKILQILSAHYAKVLTPLAL